MAVQLLTEDILNIFDVRLNFVTLRQNSNYLILLRTK